MAFNFFLVPVFSVKLKEEARVYLFDFCLVEIVLLHDTFSSFGLLICAEFAVMDFKFGLNVVRSSRVALS